MWASLLLLPALAFGFTPEELAREYLSEGPAWTGGHTSEARLPLPRFLDNYCNTGLEFTANGMPVKMSGSRAQGKPFVIFLPASGEPVFIDALGVVIGHETITINGETFEIDIDLSWRDRNKSKVRVQRVVGKKKELVFEPTIAEMIERAYQAGEPLTLGGVPFRFIHARTVVQNGKDFAFSGTKYVAFLYKQAEEDRNEKDKDRAKDKIKDYAMELPDLAAGSAALDVGATKIALRLEGDVLVVNDGAGSALEETLQGLR
jgi:hypothetical protein